MKTLQRRDFLKGVGAAGACCFGGCRLFRGDGSYEVVIFGDTHYDTEPADVYHAKYDEKVEWLVRAQRAEFVRNGEMWRERCPRLVRRASANVTERTAFLLQTGDLVQGDCGDPLVHRKMLDDAIAVLKRDCGDLPFVTVVGNHDIRGTGARAAYDGYMSERLSQELGRSVEAPNFLFAQGDDAWIVVDFNRPDADRIDRLIDEASGARRLFFVTHAPFIPSDCRNAWWAFCGGLGRRETEMRQHFRRRLAARNAIVLAGHTHRQELMDCQCDGGRITQFVMNSVWSSPDLATPVVEWQGPQNYGVSQRKVQIGADGRKLPDMMPLFDEWRPGLTRYFRENVAGSYVLRVTDAAVSVDCHAGDSPDARTVWLRHAM